MQGPRRIALLIESSRAYGRECLLGVARYARTHGPWEILHLERGLDGRLPEQIKEWAPDGLLTRIDSPGLLDAINALQTPAVDLRGAHRPAVGAMFDTDAEAVARVAFEHFRDLGFRSYAYCGYAGVDFSDLRCKAFVRIAREHGFEVNVFATEEELDIEQVIRRETLGELDGAKGLMPWLQSLPAPTAILACNDIRGRQVLKTCREAAISVPDTLAVAGVDDDEVICELSIPPLSSVEPDAERLGFEAAAMLDSLLDGNAAPENTVLLAPRGFRSRLSSETSAIDDPTVSRAIQIVRDRACEPLQMTELTKALGVSRSTLERRFREALGHSPAAQIERVRMRRAQTLLLETDYKLARIAEATGYQSAAQLVIAFKRTFDVTPGVYRSQHG